MHIVIVGAGGIGGYFGARLIGSGAQVSYVARGRSAAAIREHGLRVKSPLGDACVHPQALSEDGSGLAPADLLLFTPKLPDVAAAAPLLPRLLHDHGVVLPLQNGVDVVDLLAPQVGAARVALGAAYIAARLAEPGVVEHGGAFARLRFGPLHAAQRPLLEAFLAACARAGIDAAIPDDIRRTSWEKFVFLVGLSGLTALTRLPIGVTRSTPALRALLQQVMDEAAALAQAEGVVLPADFVAQQLAFVDSLPAGMKASMLHDLEAGRPLELPWLAGAVVRRSARHGRPAPANAFIEAALTPYAAGAPAPVTA